MARSECERCRRPAGHCLCSSIPCLDSRTRVLVLQHPSEARHALNTGRLVALGLRHAELWVGERFDGLAERLSEPGVSAALLFPGEGATVVEDASAWPAGQRLLVVPDGTWRKARKLLYLNPVLETLPRLTLPAGLASRYRLRKAPGPEALATVEAVAQLLQRLDAPLDFRALLEPFETMIEGQIEAMGEQTYRRNHAPAKGGDTG
ncbi:tRNA-uridine aminocarboxypropyltransferase [Stutzerimonas azotifigens]|uniref:tRNA-uridine aminocarboxypropyltransferase n=1 Tax=Stutzerimonas azotifigens TaxID=291995 RepID=UPI0004853E92|nr:DTW domain-containing protein [Stutzerimonas azotifigens]